MKNSVKTKIFWHAFCLYSCLLNICVIENFVLTWFKFVPNFMSVIFFRHSFSLYFLIYCMSMMKQFTISKRIWYYSFHLPVKILFGHFQMRVFFWLSNRLLTHVDFLTWVYRLVSFLLKLMVKNGGKYEPMDLQRLIELSNKASVWHISFHLPTGCNIFVVIYILNPKKVWIWSWQPCIWIWVRFLCCS